MMSRTHLGGGGSDIMWHYSISLFSKMGDKVGEGRGKKRVTLFINTPQVHNKQVEQLEDAWEMSQLSH